MRHPVLMDMDSGIMVPCNEDLGLEFQEAEAGVARCLWTPSRRSINGNGVVQGGYIGAACDAAMGFALASRLENAEGFTSLNLTVTYHRPLHQEAVEARERAGLLSGFVQCPRKIYLALPSFRRTRTALTCSVAR